MIVGLSGFKGSGKDTVAAYLVKEHGFERKAFADPIKQSIAKLFDIPFSEVEKMKNDKDAYVAIGGLETSASEYEQWIMYKGIPAITFRQFLQRYGTESHRDIFGEDLWLEPTLPSNGIYSGRKIVVSDVRFANEAKRIKEFGGRIWFINRITDRSSFDPHSSEILDFGTDWSIPNNGTIEDLYDRIEEALSVVAS
jgi:hypothetical protein